MCIFKNRYFYVLRYAIDTIRLSKERGLRRKYWILICIYLFDAYRFYESESKKSREYFFKDLTFIQLQFSHPLRTFFDTLSGFLSWYSYGRILRYLGITKRGIHFGKFIELSKFFPYSDRQR